MDKFWMVWSEFKGASTKKHDTEQAAVEEASRLANGNRGAAFNVLESKGHCMVVTGNWHPHT